MASSNDSVSMAVFCDFENVALGVRDAKYERFDIKPVLERLLLKGSIVVKKAYCDWERYKGFKAVMHEANFELIEIPHVRQSGKNSADIRLVVDALDLCYTKSHVDTFVIISGDSDFSPLVSKLRENAKHVIGVGVKQSTSDLLIGNCDEFIFYDDLVRESQRESARRETRDTQPSAKRSPEEEKRRREEAEARKSRAIGIAVETFDALVAERGDSGGRIWASMLKEAIKRRNPGFNESYYGFRAFGNLLEEAQARGLLEFGRDEKSGAYVYRNAVPDAPLGGIEGGEPFAAGEPPVAAGEPAGGSEAGASSLAAEGVESGAAQGPARGESRRKGRGGRRGGAKAAETARAAETAAAGALSEAVEAVPASPPEPALVAVAVASSEAPEPTAPPAEASAPKRGRGRRRSPAPAAAESTATAPEVVAPPAAEPAQTTVEAAAPAASKAGKKAPARPRRPRKAPAADTQ